MSNGNGVTATISHAMESVQETAHNVGAAIAGKAQEAAAAVNPRVPAAPTVTPLVVSTPVAADPSSCSLPPESSTALPAAGSPRLPLRSMM